MNLKQFIQCHPLLSYFLGAYGITWVLLVLFFASKGFDASNIQLSDIAIMLLLMLLGPSTSGIFLTLQMDGSQGIRELFGRMTRWRVGIQWYAVALLTNPLLTLAILSILALTLSESFRPGFMVIGIAVGLIAGGFEELGWTGFATPRLLSKFNPLLAGLVLGVLWAVWHSFADYLGNINTMGAGWLPHFLVFWLLPLTAYRILMVWVYSNTQSLLLAQLMHASYTGWLVALTPATSFDQSMLWQTIFAVSLWVLVLVLIVVSRREQVGRLLAAHSTAA